MPFQVKEIILYSQDGQQRRLRFKTQNVNIITGRSGTGKSAIISIIDYCMGRSTFTVPEGFIREAVTWYAILLRVGDGTDIFIAKPAPKRSAKSQSQAFISVGGNIDPPAFSELSVNSNDEAVEELLSKYLGISPNIHLTERWQSRPQLQATVKHTKFYLFQEQGLIANRDLLFFRQSEEHLPTAMKDTLPYLLGAVSEDRVAKLSELRELKREIKMLERDIVEVKSISGGGMTKGLSLIAEAQQVGIIKAVPKVANTSQLRATLKNLMDWIPTTLPEDGEYRAPKLRNEIMQLRSQLKELSELIQTAEAFTSHASAYEGEVHHQKARLESIDLFNDHGDTYCCPFCGEKTNQLQPPRMVELRKRLESIRGQLSSVEMERPRLSKYTEELNSRITSIRQVMREKQKELASVEAEDERAKIIIDQNSRIARLLGRVSLYLESEPAHDDTKAITAQLSHKMNRAERLEKQLEEDSGIDRLESYINRIGRDMTGLASQLPFEHSDNPLRLDLRNLTVVSDRPHRPFTMQRMGSAQNWLVCHISTLLALHRHFRTERRPVPAFLILDQPSQVYFPSDFSYRNLGGTTEETETIGADLQAVRQLFQLLFSTVKELSGELQLIVLEHANLSDSTFQESLVEGTWNGYQSALVPPEWRPIE